MNGDDEEQPEKALWQCIHIEGKGEDECMREVAEKFSLDDEQVEELRQKKKMENSAKE